ncbi:hypothetical protein AB0G81_24955 [Streptomyces asoensis]|uniref:hypothetical protein n=1 Tax=Streptomyces asoensis TaxID=249586 RepID=UPI0033EBF378
MSDDALQNALAAAAVAADDSRQLELVKAVLTAQTIAAAMQPHTCQHDHQVPQRQPFDARKWCTVGGLVVVGGCIACGLALAFAMAFIAVAVAATCGTGCFIILRSMWRDYLNHR